MPYSVKSIFAFSLTETHGIGPVYALFSPVLPDGFSSFTQPIVSADARHNYRLCFCSPADSFQTRHICTSLNQFFFVCFYPADMFVSSITWIAHFFTRPQFFLWMGDRLTV